MKEKSKMEKEVNVTMDIRKLKKLRKLVFLEIERYEENDANADMTITDLEYWLEELDGEISKLSE
jgi:hypothetical protein